ncbi:MAG: FG-GAP-like repeat-containing protein, partial [Planctomycetota bacterium]|nr:FG-GAP-like repeat-containing protein [Planctomycetota bacterium]
GIAAEIHVYPEDSIQTAINDAADGDVIIVHEGTYSERINLLGKAITVRSTDPSDLDVVANTIIDGGSAGTVVLCESGESNDTILDGLTITNGSADFGGGIANFYSSPTVANCVFSGNGAVYGGAMFSYGGEPVVTGSTFTGNAALYDGGAIYNYFSDATVTDCGFGGNTADAHGGAIWNTENASTITSCTFTGNSAPWGGAICNDYCFAAVSNCVFTENSADSGGGMANVDGGDPTIVSCTFIGNTALDDGGGMINDDSSPTVVNCLFRGNTAGKGGGVFNRDDDPAVISCTFWNNSADAGGGMANDYADPTVTNCILWGNTPGAILNEPGSPIVTYCNVQDGYQGEGNINTDPVFVDGGGGDLRLQIGSPCIDAGNSDAVPPDITVDLDGNPRFIDDPNTFDTGIGNPCVDMGAFEFGGFIYDPPEEVASVAEPTDADTADFTGDGNNDIAITELGPSPDANGNLVLLRNEDGSGLQYEEQVTEIGREPSALVIADFDPGNSNGPDVAVCNAGDNTVTILLNDGQGNGEFLPPAVVDVGDHPSAIAAGYFNNDAFLDLAVANKNDNTVRILTNDDGSGAFSPADLLEVGNAPSALAAADFDGDELIDLAVANEADNTVMIFLNTGARGFQHHTTIEVDLGPGVLEPEDLDDDEDIDMVVGNTGSDTIDLLVNTDGQATFQPIRLTIGEGPSSIDFGDLDLDGDQDILVVADTPESRAVRILRNEWDAADIDFTLVIDFAPDPNLRLTVTEDLNGDDLPDIIAVNAPPEGMMKPCGMEDEGSVLVLLHALPPEPPCPADFDGSGVVDTADLLHLLGCWGTPCGDVNGDGNTDTADLLALLGAWGDCP